MAKLVLEIPIVDELLADKDTNLDLLTKLIHDSTRNKIYRALYNRRVELLSDQS